MTHQQLKRFQITGEFLDEADLPKIRAQYESLLIHKMRDLGYVRTLDIDPAFSVQYDLEKWKFLITIHGVHVGKSQAWQLEGISQNKLIRRIPPRTLNQL